MKRLKVCPGICGLETVIGADSEDGTEVNLTFETACPKVKEFLESLKKPLDAYEICFSGCGANAVYENAGKLHAACPVPCAVIKCMEAECSLALPKNVSMEFTD